MNSILKTLAAALLLTTVACGVMPEAEDRRATKSSGESVGLEPVAKSAAQSSDRLKTGVVPPVTITVSCLFIKSYFWKGFDAAPAGKPSSSFLRVDLVVAVTPGQVDKAAICAAKGAQMDGSIGKPRSGWCPQWKGFDFNTYTAKPKSVPTMTQAELEALIVSGKLSLYPRNPMAGG